VEADCKSTTFLETGNKKIQLFLIKYYTILKTNQIKFYFFIKRHKLMHKMEDF